MLLSVRAEEPKGREKEIADLEKQLVDLKKKLDDLKKKADPPRALTIADLPNWPSIRGTAISVDGKWFGYSVGPREGERHIVIRSTQNDKEFRFPGGEGLNSMAFSHDSKWFAFTVPPKSPTPGSPDAPKSQGKTKVALVSLPSGDKTEFEGIRRFVFSGEAATHIALVKSPPEGPGPPTSGDLLLRELATGNELNLGGISDFAFDKKGRWLAMLIDSPGQVGSGVQVREMSTGVLSSLESAKASYSGLNWTKEGEGLTCLKQVDGKPGEPKHASVLGFITRGDKWDKIVYDPSKDQAFPKGMIIGDKQSVAFTDDLGGITFGIQDTPKKDADVKKDDGKKSEAKKDEPKKDEPKKDEPKKIEAKKDGPKPPTGDKPEVVIWHWKDERLQSQQQVEAGADRVVSYLCVYRIKDKKFLRLADDKVRRVSAAPKQRWAIGLDRKPYQYMGTLDGRRYQDVYVIDMHTGERKQALTHCRWFNGSSAAGTHFLYYEDGHYFTYEMATGKKYNISAGCSASFVDTEDDHNVEKPPTRNLGWSKDDHFVLLSDNWDIWRLPVHGDGPGQNLTGNGRKDGIRYGSISVFDFEEPGYDLFKPLYVSTYGEWTKKSGFTRLDPTGPAQVLIWADASVGSLAKAKKADIYFYTHETSKEYPDYYSTGPGFGSGKRLTNAVPDQKKFLWSSGTKLVDYASTKGDRLQAALFLPANYQAGKKYPTVVYIYEHLSQQLHRYPHPALNGFNPAMYLSNGYAVLMPDIHYKVNDPGTSSVGCILPALDAAIKTGIVDQGRVGLHGHSWGGYQTAFAITQTDAFKAAVAGAPLTDLVSMYSSIYWNSGSANQPIFESSQGRFSTGFMDNLEAYIRNSPVYHAKAVKTPLLLLHNDKDGAVDWNQGIEYFNTLRRLQKPVVMLQYKGENHGVVKPANRKDYTIRMKEYFDHYLMDKPAPDWLREGVPHIKMEEHLKSRAKN